MPRVFDPDFASRTQEELAEKYNDTNRPALCLRQHFRRDYLRLFDIHEGNVVSPSVVRPPRTRELAFFSQHTCMMSVRNEDAREITESDEQFTAEDAEILAYTVGDGNHRLDAARRILGPTSGVPCHIYKQLMVQET